LAGLFAVALIGCASESERSVAAPPQRGVKPISNVPGRAVELPPPGVLPRAEVVAVVDRGLGSFLQRVQVEPSFHGGTFRGWSLLRLSPPEFWSGVDLRPGDVVVSVNGKTIERPEQAHEVFQELRSAERLVIHFERGGEARELVYPIAPGDVASR
jgi:type II secretory pathway component PulC